MTRFATEEEARNSGFEITHRPDENAFVVTHGDNTVGYARYSLRGDEAIDFNGTVIDENLRGTGLAGLLVTRAVSDPIVEGRAVAASCWYVAKFLDSKPDALAAGATRA